MMATAGTTNRRETTIRSKQISTRRCTKQECYSPYMSSARLRKVQKLLHNAITGGHSSTDPGALLLILGIDGRYNEGCKELANHLLFDFFAVRRKEFEDAGYDDEIIEDLIIVIKHHAVHVYCNPINYAFLTPYIGPWPNLQIHCMTEKEYEDVEKAEDFKIHSLIEMIHDCKHVAIPFSSYKRPKQMSPFDVEQWPIIQAFASGDYQSGGFFTIQFEVTDISVQVHKCYLNMDPVSLEAIITTNLPQLDYQWASMVSTIEFECKQKGILNITEDVIAGPLSSFYTFGKLSNVNLTGSTGTKQLAWKPFLLFGTHTEKEGIKKHSAGSKQNAAFKTCGLANKPPCHMVCQAMSPNSPLYCSRTYFFGSDHDIYPVGDLNSVAEHGEGQTLTDLQLITNIYIITVDACLSAIYCYINTQSIAKSSSALLTDIQKAAKNQNLPLPSEFFTYLASKGNIEFTIQSFNNMGQEIPITEGHHSLQLKVARICIYNIPSFENTGKTIGSLVFAETFLDSNFSIINNKKVTSDSSACLILTRNIPRYLSFAVTAADVERYKQVDKYISNQESEEKYGLMLMNGETVKICSTSSVNTPETVSLYMMEQAVIMLSGKFGALVIPYSMLDSISYYDGNSPSAVMVLLLTYKLSLIQYIPKHIVSADHLLVVAFEPKSTAYKHLYAQVLPSLKSTQTMIKSLDILPQLLQPVYAGLQKQYDVQTVVTPMAGTRSLKSSQGIFPELSGFMGHLSVSSSHGDIPLPSTEVRRMTQPSLSPLGSFTVDEDRDKLVVTIIAGSMGSHKDTLASTLVRNTEQYIRWVVIDQPTSPSLLFDAKYYQKELSACVNVWKQMKSQQMKSSEEIEDDRKMRVLIVTPHFTDIALFIQLICQHPEYSLTHSIIIGSVTACVDPINTFMFHKRTIPKLLELVTPGFVNNVLFIGVFDTKCNEFTETQKIVRSVNEKAAFFVANSGDINRANDVEAFLSETAFNQDDMIKIRLQTCPGWTLGKYEHSSPGSAFNYVSVNFKQPVEHNKFVARIKGMRSALKHCVCDNNIYYVKGRLTFSDNPSKMVDIEYVSLTGKFSEITSRGYPTSNNNSSNYMMFIGCNVHEEKMKEWLRSCTKPKPEKKDFKTKQVLTQHELKNIHSKHHLDPLPDGYFYNGSQYVSLFGDKSSTHPNMDTFIDTYLTEVNATIQKHNANIDSQSYIDLFD